MEIILLLGEGNDGSVNMVVRKVYTLISPHV